MKKYIDDFALWIGIISSVSSLVVFISEDTSAWFFYSLVGISVAFLAYAIIYKIIEAKPYPSNIDGIHINALDLLTASDSSTVMNCHLKIEKADIKVEIIESDSKHIYNYSGKVSSKINDSLQGIFFRFASEANDSINPNKYYGYDLISDPERKNPIDLEIISVPGMSKSLFFPFQITKKKNDIFNVEIHCEVHNSYPSIGVTYHFVKFSFPHSTFFRHTIDYSFCMEFHDKPFWVNNNEITSKKFLIKHGPIVPIYDDKKMIICYKDCCPKYNISSIRVYTFQR